MESNAKLNILKYGWHIPDQYTYHDANTTIFTANEADYGGAVYVDDNTISGTCASDPKIDCFFQVLPVHDTSIKYLKTQSIYFSRNHAKISGSTLYGGLLDRCAAGQFAEVHYKQILSIKVAEKFTLRTFLLVRIP